jgi:hypothetical protein
MGNSNDIRSMPIVVPLFWVGSSTLPAELNAPYYCDAHEAIVRVASHYTFDNDNNELHFLRLNCIFCG